MKIVHVARTDNFAGVERYITSLAATQAQNGHDVAAIGGLQRAMADALAPVGVETMPAGSIPELVARLDRLGSADIFHLHMTEAEGAAALALRSRKVPAVSTRHFGSRRGSSVVGGLSKPLIERRISAQIAVSRYVADRIEGASTVVHPGVPTQPAVSPDGRRKSILMAQRLEPEKGSDVGVSAFAASGLQADGWRLEICGTGSEADRLRALARELSVEDAVVFRGFVDDMAAELATCGVLLAPSAIEGFGLSVVEAMSWGTPVVAAGAGGHLETVGMVSAQGLFAPSAVDEAAVALRRLAADDQGRADYGAALRAAQSELFTLERQARQIDAVYEELV